MKYSRIFTIWCFILFTPAFLSAQNGIFRLFNQKNGLTTKSIKSIVKDKNGHVWLGTEKGLVKFDGLSFCEIVPNFYKYKSSEISQIKICNNILFLNYRNKGCITYNLNTFEFKEISKTPINEIEPITEHVYYVISNNGLFYKQINNRVSPICLFNIEYGATSISFFKGNIYVVTDIGLFCFDFKTNKILSKCLDLPISVNAHFSISNKYLHLINAGSVFLIDSITNKNNYSLLPVKKNIPEQVNDFIYVNDKFYFYLYNYKKLVRGEVINKNDSRYIYNINSIDNIQFRCVFVYDTLNQLIATNQGLIWISKHKNGIKSINDNRFYDNILRVRRSILELSKDELLLFGNPSVIKYNRNTNNFKSLIHNCTFYNAIKIKNKIYVSTNDRGIVKLKNNYSDFDVVYCKGPKDRLYLGLYYDTLKNLLVAGGKNNVVILNPNQNDKIVSKFYFKCGLIKVIVWDNLNKVYWLGSEKSLLGINVVGEIIYKYDYSVLGTNYTLSNISDLLIINNEKKLYISQSNGVYVLDLNTLNNIYKLPFHDELIENAIALEEDNDHNIWIATYQGLIKYSPRINKLFHLDNNIDLLNGEFNYTSSAKLADGTFMFGGINGYDVIDPKIINRYNHNISPKISSIFKISRKDTVQCNIINNKIEFNSSNEILIIYLNKPFTINDDYYNTYEYSIDNNVWVKMNAFPQILISNLPDGNHILKIRSIEDLIHPQNTIVINIKSYIPFYKSIVFAWSILFLLTVFILLFLYAFRRIGIEKKIIKNQIAMDLHDEVGTVLTSALFYSRKLNDNHLTNTLEKSLNSLRAYIYSIRDKKVKIINLIDDLYEMLNFLSIESDIKISFKYHDFKDEEINSILFRDLKLTFYEIIANVQKHSFCTRFDVFFTKKNNNIYLTFIDNGVLTDLKNLYFTGNGIENISKRINKHKGEVKFNLNDIGYGLRIEIILGINK